MSLHTAKETASGLATVSFNDDQDTGLHSSAANTVSLMAGGTTVFSSTASSTVVGSNSGATGITFSATENAPRSIKVALTAGSTVTATSTTSIANPIGASAMILGAHVLVTAASTGAATLDVGVGASATTGSDTLMDGITVNGVSANTILSSSNATDAGTNGAAGKGRLWTSSQFVTVQNKADTTGLTGTLYVTYIPI